MTKRKVFHVTPSSREGWDVTVEGSGRSVCHKKTKQEAVKCGRKIAKDTKPSQIKIHDKKGRIQTEFTYLNDPRRFKG